MLKVTSGAYQSRLYQIYRFTAVGYRLTGPPEPAVLPDVMLPAGQGAPTGKAPAITAYNEIQMQMECLKGLI